MSVWLAILIGALTPWLMFGVFCLFSLIEENYPWVIVVLVITGLGAFAGLMAATFPER